MPCRRSMIPGSRMQLWTFLADRTYQRDIKPVPALSCGGCVSIPFGRALAWHARGHRFDPGILHQKALYFVESMVLFFLLKPIFGGCIASPAPFSGFCRRFLYNPQLLTLHRFQKGMFAARFLAGCCIIPFNVRRKVEVEGNVELIPTINIQYVKESLENHSKKCSKQKLNAIILT